MAGDGGFGVLVADVLLEVAALVERVQGVVEAGAAVLLDGDALGLAVGVDADVDIERGDAGGVDADDGVAQDAALAGAGEDPDGLAEAAERGGLGHDHGHVAEHDAGGAGLLALEVLDLGVARGEEQVEGVWLRVGAGFAAQDRAGVGSGGGEVLVGEAEEFDEGGVEGEFDLFERCAGGEVAGGRGGGGEFDACAAFGIGLVAAFCEADPVERDGGLLGDDAGEGAVVVEGRLDAVDALEQRLPAADGVGVVVDVGGGEGEGRHFVGMAVGLDERPATGGGGGEFVVAGAGPDGGDADAVSPARGGRVAGDGGVTGFGEFEAGAAAFAAEVESEAILAGEGGLVVGEGDLAEDERDADAVGREAVFDEGELVGADDFDAPREAGFGLAAAVALAAAAGAFDEAVTPVAEAAAFGGIGGGAEAGFGLREGRQPVEGALPVEDAVAEADLAVGEFALDAGAGALVGEDEAVLEDLFEVVGGGAGPLGVVGRFNMDAERVLAQADAEFGPGAAGGVGLPAAEVLEGFGQARVGGGRVEEVLLAGADALVEGAEAGAGGGCAAGEAVDERGQLVEAHGRFGGGAGRGARHHGDS